MRRILSGARPSSGVTMATEMTNPSQRPAHVFGVLAAERARAGSQVQVTVPLRQAALDAALAQVVWPAPVEALAVEIGDANRLHVTAAVRVLGFRTEVRLQLRIAPTMEDGIVRIAIDDGSLLASAVALLGPLLGRLPAGVTLQGRQISIDVPRLAAQQGVEDLAGMVSTATFDTSPGVLWMSVHAAAPAPRPAATQQRVHEQHLTTLPAIDPAQLLAWLRGASVDVDVHMDERLANELLAALHAAAQVPSGDPVRDAFIRAVQKPLVRFEAGTVRVSANAALDDDRPSDS
jgi:hypothetical protein